MKIFHELQVPFCVDKMMGLLTVFLTLKCSIHHINAEI